MSRHQETHPLTMRFPRLPVRAIRVTEREEYELELGPEHIQEIIYRLFPDLSTLLGEQALKIAKLEERLEELEKASDATKKLSIEQHKMQLQDMICKKLRELLEREYKGKYVAITYDGRIVAFADTDIQLLQELEKIDYPADQIFLHKVGSRAITGWL